MIGKGLAEVFISLHDQGDAHPRIDHCGRYTTYGAVLLRGEFTFKAPGEVFSIPQIDHLPDDFCRFCAETVPFYAGRPNPS